MPIIIFSPVANFGDQPLRTLVSVTSDKWPRLAKVRGVNRPGLKID